MQTFLPYEDFAKTASVLDRQRLGKQRVETLQILRALAGESKGWTNHPATKMWRGYEQILIGYGRAICYEWVTIRGYRDTCCDKITAYSDFFAPVCWVPRWLGDDEFHRSHQSNLIRKDAEFYGPLFPDVPADLPYVWPAPPREAAGRIARDASD